jgi:hypothetical protein
MMRIQSIQKLLGSNAIILSESDREQITKFIIDSPNHFGPVSGKIGKIEMLGEKLWSEEKYALGFKIIELRKEAYQIYRSMIEGGRPAATVCASPEKVLLLPSSSPR